MAAKDKPMTDNRVRTAIMTSKLPAATGLGFGGFTLAITDLDDFQLGYRVHANTGENLTATGHGDQKPSWFVISTDRLEDSLFVDAEDDELAVMSAVHGIGDWLPKVIAPSFTTFVMMFDALAVLAVGRESPVALESSLISDTERAQFNQVVRENGGDLDWWMEQTIEED